MATFQWFHPEFDPDRYEMVALYRMSDMIVNYIESLREGLEGSTVLFDCPLKLLEGVCDSKCKQFCDEVTKFYENDRDFDISITQGHDVCLHVETKKL